MIHLVQCLCPHRHCILAVCSDDEPSAAERALREAVQSLLLGRQLNPWCALCGAPAREWRYEAGETPFQTMEEAQSAIAEVQEANLRTQATMIASGRAYDSKRRSEN